MNTNSLLQEYYKALQEALQQIFKALTSVRKDTLTRLVLGGIIGGTATEIAQAVGMDYETVLKNLDKIANINLIKIVKEIVKDHPVQLRRHTQPQRIRKSNTSIKKRNTSLLLQRTQRYEPAIQLLIIAIKDLRTNETYVVTIIPYIPQKVAEILKEKKQNTKQKSNYT